MIYCFQTLLSMSTCATIQRGVRVVWPPLMNDNGMGAYPGVLSLLRRETEDTREKGRHIFLTFHGLHAGAHWLNVKGFFRPGRAVQVDSIKTRVESAYGFRA
jgi:hypothetical protein